MTRAVMLRSSIGKGSSPLWTTSLRMRSTATSANHFTVDQAKPFEEMPGPKPLPIIGNVWRFLPGIGKYSLKDGYATQKKLREQYGDIVRLSGIAGRPPMVFTFNPADIETIFRSEGQWPQRPGSDAITYYYKNLKKDITGGRAPVAAGDGEEWQTLRSIVQQPIMQPRVARMYISSVEQVADEFIDRIRGMRDNKKEMPKDFHNQLYRWALESIGIIALDTRLGCLQPNLPPDSEPQRLINAVQDMFQCFLTLGLGIPLWRYFNTPTWNRFEKSMDTCTSICVKYTNRAVDSLKNRSADIDKELTLIQRLLQRDPDPGTSVLAALDLLLPGIDTTAFSSANLLYFLAKNPDKQQKLYEEIKRILPTKDTTVTDERMDEMKYLKACLKESLRIAPLAIGSIRTIQKDAVFSGYKVPKGAIVFSGNAVMGTDSKIFPMGDKFIPERWLRGEDASCPFSKEEQSIVHPFSSIPFGHGPRMCLGRRFAEMEIQMLVLKVLQNFHVEFNYETTFSTADKLLYTLHEPMKFAFKDRK